uniref:Solute carrier family 22 member 18 isoform X23 n=1 Tax=Tursiops truncatus TaxID=9739 RepID=A0A6J3RS48_TURTR|nr:solute carrier family 22 member 18 isoform X23 [Tursiops truncatus]
MRVRRPGGGGGQPPGRGGGGGEFIPGGWVSQVPRRGRVPEPCPGWARPELTQEGSPHQDGAQADPYEASCSDPYGVSQQRLPRMREVRASRGQGRSPSRTGTLDLSRVMLLVYVLAALELACLFMQFSVMPYLSRRLGLDSVAFGYQQTIFGVLQLLGGPVFGRFADQRGARAAFTLSFLASSALYLLLAAACSPALPGVPLLFASRLPGALMHTLPAAQMAITDLSAPEERPAALGRLGLCFGVGVIFGSLLGGTLSSTCGIQCPVIVAFVVSLLGAVLSLTCIPTSTKGASARAQAALPGKLQQTHPTDAHKQAHQVHPAGSALPDTPHRLHPTGYAASGCLASVKCEPSPPTSRHPGPQARPPPAQPTLQGGFAETTMCQSIAGGFSPAGAEG